MNNRLINTKVAGGGGGCTDIVDNYDPFGGNGVALYQLNGDATDVSGNYNGTASNVTYGTGVFGQAGVFNGSNSYVSSPYNVGGDLTISGWVKFDTINTDEPIFCLDNIGGSGSRALQIKRISSNKLYAYIFTGSDITGTTNLTSGVWYHIVATFQSNVALRVYINGQFEGQSTNVATRPTQPNLFFGKYGDGSLTDVLDGSIDQVRIFNTALTPLEVEALYTEELCICDGTVDTLDILGDGSCIATYQLDGNANDLSGNYSGTPTDVSYGVGEFDLAGVYTPAVSQIVLPDLQGLFTSKTTSTVSLWFNSNSTATNNQWLFADYSSTSFNYLVYLNFPSAGKIRLLSRYSSVTTTTDSVSTGLNDGNWHHLVVMVDIANLKHRIYIDGNFDIEANLPSNAYNGSSPVTYLGGYNLDGSIDQVRIFNKALSAGEVTTLYNETACTYTPKDYITTDLALDFFSKDITAASTTWTDRANSNVLTKSGSTVYNNATELVDFTGGYWGNDSLTETLKDASGDFTVEFYGELDNSTYYAIAGAVQSPTIRGFFMTNGPTIDGYNYQTGSNSNSQGIDYPSQSGRVHIVIEYDNSANQKFYLNGVLVKTTTLNIGNPYWTSPNGMRLGDDRTLSYSSSMNMGIFRIYKGLLSEQDIITNYNWAIRQF